MLFPSVNPSLLRTLSVWALVIAAIHLLMRFQHAIPYLSQISAALTAVLLIYPPTLISLTEKKSLDYWSMNRESLLGALKWFLMACLAIFPAAFLVNHFYQSWIFKLHYGTRGSPPWLAYAFTQLLLIAFPEEFFFRGYVQGEFAKIFPTQRRVFGAPFGKPQILTSILFAFSHSLIAIQWWHAFIFFPSLVFAWLKEKTGTVWAGTLFHAACNLFAFWVATHYGP